jgi:hypothetical protein
MEEDDLSSITENVAVASYNMSFMSDENKSPEDTDFASEATFLFSNKEWVNANNVINMGEVNNADARRNYWNNAKDLLEKFIREQHRNKLSCVIGLQEMNEGLKGSDTGSDAIDTMLETLNNTLKTTQYEQIVRTTTKGELTLAISIIYDTNKFGKPREIQDGKPAYVWDIIAKGRPRMLIITENNDVFITMHGAQDPKLGKNKENFNKYIEDENKINVQEKINEILTNNGFSAENLPNNIFLMSDLNDRYDAIKEFDILGQKINYGGLAPLSCCHNWDSSCTDERYKKFDESYGTCDDDKDKYNILSKESLKDENGNPIIKKGKEIYLKLPMPNEEGHTKNYRYRGDKVFGITDENDKPEIKIYRGKGKDGLSVESDHELVYAIFKYKHINTNLKTVKEKIKDYDLKAKQHMKDKAVLADYDDEEGGGRKRSTRKRSGTKKSKKGRNHKKTKKRSRKTRRKHKRKI